MKSNKIKTIPITKNFLIDGVVIFLGPCPMVGTFFILEKDWSCGCVFGTVVNGGGADDGGVDMEGEGEEVTGEDEGVGFIISGGLFAFISCLFSHFLFFFDFVRFQE